MPKPKKSLTSRPPSKPMVRAVGFAVALMGCGHTSSNMGDPPMPDPDGEIYLAEPIAPMVPPPMPEHTGNGESETPEGELSEEHPVEELQEPVPPMTPDSHREHQAERANDVLEASSEDTD